MKSLSDAQIRKSFERQLNNALTIGEGGITDEGLNLETLYAINAVARAFPNPSNELVQAAKAAFEKWMTEPIDWEAMSARYAAG